MELPAWLLNIFGNTVINKFPFWVQYKPNKSKITGNNIREIINVIKPGDIILRKSNGYVSNIGIKGFYSHVGIFFKPHYVYHSAGNGVVKDDIIDFCKTDNVCVVRPYTTPLTVSQAKDTAIKFFKEGIPYDYKFKRNLNLSKKKLNKLSKASLIDIIEKENLKIEDYDFKSKKVIIEDIYKLSKAVYCSEYIDECYKNYFVRDYEVYLGHNVLPPNNIYNSKKVEKIIEFRND